MRCEKYNNKERQRKVNYKKKKKRLAPAIHNHLRWVNASEIRVLLSLELWSVTILHRAPSKCSVGLFLSGLLFLKSVLPFRFMCLFYVYTSLSVLLFINIYPSIYLFSFSITSLTIFPHSPLNLVYVLHSIRQLHFSSLCLCLCVSMCVCLSVCLCLSLSFSLSPFSDCLFISNH